MNYLEQEKILRKNVGMLPRTWDDAVKGADYAQWLDVPKSDTQQALEWFSELFLAILWGAVAVGFSGALFYWLFFK